MLHVKSSFCSSSPLFPRLSLPALQSRTFLTFLTERNGASLLCHPWTTAFYFPVMGLAWLDARCPPKLLYHFPSSAELGEEIY